MKSSSIHYKSIPDDSDPVHSYKKYWSMLVISVVEYSDPKERSRESPVTPTCLSHVFKTSLILCFIMHVLVKAIHILLINKCKYVGEVCTLFFYNKVGDFKSSRG